MWGNGRITQRPSLFVMAVVPVNSLYGTPETMLSPMPRGAVMAPPGGMPYDEGPKMCPANEGTCKGFATKTGLCAGHELALKRERAAWAKVTSEQG